MDEVMDPELAKALERYALVGGILHRRGERGDVVRQVQEIAASELVLQDGTSQISRATLYRIVKAAREGGAYALRRRRRKDRGIIRAIAPEIVERLVALRTEYPGASAPVLIRTLELQGEVAAGQLRPSTVRRVLHNLAPRAQEDKTKRAYRRFEVAGPLALWQGDASPGPWLHGQRLQIYAWLDAYSRTIVAARYYLNQRLPAFDDCLWRAIARYGVPAAVHVDNGSPYTSHHFLRVLADLGIQPIHARPRQPTGKGRIERLWGTCQDRLVSELRLAEADDLASANRVLAAFVPAFNAAFAVPAAVPEHAWRPAPRARELERICAFRYTRTVGNDNTVRLEGAVLQLPATHGGRGLAGRRVELELRLDGRLLVVDRGRTLLAVPAPPDPARLRGILVADPGGPPVADGVRERPGYPPAADHPWRRRFLDERPRGLTESLSR